MKSTRGRRAVWAVAGIAVLGAGLLYAIGVQTEQQFIGQLSRLQQNPQIRVDDSRYRRGLLSAQARQTLSPGGPASNTFELSHDIRHTLLVTPTRVHTRVRNRKTLAGLPPHTALLELDTRLGLTGSGTTRLHLPALAADNDLKLSWTPGHGEVVFDAGTGRAQGQFTLAALHWQPGGPALHLRDAGGDFAWHPETAGTLTLQVAQADYQLDESLAVQGQRNRLRAEFRPRPPLLDLHLRLDSQALRVGAQTYAPAELELHIRNLNPALVPPIIRTLQQLQRQPPYLRWMSLMTLTKQALELAQSSPQLRLNRLALHTPDGPALSAELELDTVADESIGPLRLPFKAKGSATLAESVLIQFLRLQAAHTRVELKPAQLMNPLLEKGYVKLKNGVYHSRFTFDGGGLQINPADKH